MDALPDYTGVPAGQLREQIALHLGGRSKRWLSEKTGIDPRELDRIMTKAADRAIIGLDKADRILLALRQSVTLLDILGEINVVPLGGNLKNAKLMAEDMFNAAGEETDAQHIEGLARCLLGYKQVVLEQLDARLQADQAQAA